jgi:hypothetical protein
MALDGRPDQGLFGVSGRDDARNGGHGRCPRGYKVARN